MACASVFSVVADWLDQPAALRDFDGTAKWLSHRCAFWLFSIKTGLPGGSFNHLPGLSIFQKGHPWVEWLDFHLAEESNP